MEITGRFMCLFVAIPSVPSVSLQRSWLRKWSLCYDADFVFKEDFE